MVNIDASGLLPVLGAITGAIHEFTSFPFHPGFDIKNVTLLATSLPAHSWEYGTAAQTLLELYNPELSVFGARPFPVPVVDKDDVRGLKYAVGKVKLGSGYNALAKGEGSSGDPASLGVAAVMVGKGLGDGDRDFGDAAKMTVEGLLNDVPRFWNGAISHRGDVAELWADFMYMAPPFLAYYAADTNDASLMQESVRQCRLYRSILRDNSTGVWRHIIGPQSQDTGLWATGNAWAVAGMTRIIATLLKAPVSAEAVWGKEAVDELTGYVKEIVDGAMKADGDDGLVRNYMYDPTNPRGFGEISGSTLIAASIYRMVVLRPDVFASQGSRYVDWANAVLRTIGGEDKDGKPHVTERGVVRPAVNPLDWHDVNKFEKGSPEGNCFVVLMYAAWRDCVLANRCRNPDAEPVGPAAGGAGGSGAGDGGERYVEVSVRPPPGGVRARRGHDMLRRSMTTHGL